jgi:protoheme IX farnesyltransferase
MFLIVILTALWRMERTQNRPIHTGRISVRAGTIYALVLGITGELILTFGVHPLAAMLALVGLLVYVFIYTMWLKRTTTFNTVVGGISGAMPTMMGYVAVTENIDLTAWVIFAILFLWQPPHFLALAMRRTEEYRNAGIPMLPVVKGFTETKRQILFYTLAMIPVTMMLYNLQAVGLIYLAGVSILNVIYLWYALKGMSIKAEQEISWANFMFRYSVIYLTLLYILMMIDAK